MRDCGGSAISVLETEYRSTRFVPNLRQCLSECRERSIVLCLFSFMGILVPSTPYRSPVPGRVILHMLYYLGDQERESYPDNAVATEYLSTIAPLPMHQQTPTNDKSQGQIGD